jgi:hypothetical protein
VVVLKTGVCRIVLVALVAVVALVSSVEAGTIVTGDKVKIIGFDGGSLGAGPMKVDGPDADLPPVTDFITFCLEVNEFVTFNTEFHARIAMEARNGGAGGSVLGADPLDPRTAYLYRKYLANPLQFNNVTKKDALQLAIWRIEQEVYRDASNPAPSSMVYRRADNNIAIGNNAKAVQADIYYNEAVAANPQVFYGVKVMQLWATKEFTGNKQDLLIFEPVPEAVSTLGILAIGLVGVGALRNRLRR